MTLFPRLVGRSPRVHPKLSSFWFFLVTCGIAMVVWNNSLDSRGLQTMTMLLQNSSSSSTTMSASTRNGVALMSKERLIELHNQLVGTPSPDTATCGNPENPFDCPRVYPISSIQESASLELQHDAEIYANYVLAERHATSRKTCTKYNHTETGGWCLSDRGASIQHYRLQLPNGHSLIIPKGHVSMPRRIGDVIVDLFQKEKVKSVTDFGAGCGQLGAFIVPKLNSSFVYHGYDGAGDIEEFTNGFLKFADLTLPLNLPKTDWVVSLEVGEHIPSHLEGVFIRNLHRHNCRGILLSWGILGQNGENHINNHRNDYVANIFHELGYVRDTQLETELRKKNKNFIWFRKSAMAFRRIKPVC